jgi:hypothetical protein
MDYFAFRLISLVALVFVVASIIAYVAWGVSRGRDGHRRDDSESPIDL